MRKDLIHEYFGLTYSNYLVLPRLVLQSMPDEWQQEFVKMLYQIPELLGTEWEPERGYRVLALDSIKKVQKDPYSNYERGRRKLAMKGMDNVTE
jgi:hypothetical protein